MFRIYILAASLLLTLNANACNFAQLSFSDELPTGRMGSCELKDDGSILITLSPENTPINPSPWYHFSVTAKFTGKVALALTAKEFNPRYMPKFSTDDKHWQPLAFDTDNNQVLFEVPVTAGKPTYIAAQPPISNQDYKEWLSDLASRHPTLAVSVLGQSKQGRDILAVTKENPDNHEWLVIMGRQHPPEITGALALIDFTEQMLDTGQLSARFFERFNVLWLPNVNPDGVAAGNWRHTTENQDLNRDWVKFSQPESRLVRDKLNAITAAGGKIAFSVDFHSTHYDVFYTMPEDYPLAPKNFTKDWLSNMQDYTKGFFKVTVKPGSNPNNGVYKQFIADTYKVPAVTYEMGDNTPREKIRYIAKAAAKTLMEEMLKHSPEDYVLHEE